MQYINPYIEFCLENAASIFRDIPQREKEMAIQHHSVTRIRRGGYLYREGEKSKGLICLAEGKAKIFRIGIGGREHIMKLIRPGDLTGYQPLLSDTLWPATSVAIEDSVICTIEKSTLTRILKNNADLSFRLSRMLAGELSRSYDKMVSLTQKHVRGRLAESLLMLAGIYGLDNDGRTIQASLSRNDIAHLSNMTTSNAIRTLSNFASEGILKIRGRKISVLDMPELERISRQA